MADALANVPLDGKAGDAKRTNGGVKRFDWHSQVTVRFAEGDGGAGWSRSKRTVTVNSGYVRRFIEQGRRAALAADR